MEKVMVLGMTMRARLWCWAWHGHGMEKVTVLGMAMGCSRRWGQAKPEGFPLSSLRLQVVSSSVR